jgi:hypothetical protein
MTRGRITRCLTEGGWGKDRDDGPSPTHEGIEGWFLSNTDVGEPAAATHAA